MELLDVGQVKLSLGTTVAGSRILYYLSTGSTMDIGREAAARGCPEGTVIVAEEQTTGRGRFQRSWVSPPGVNLYWTLVLYPSLHTLRRLTMATSLGVAKGVTKASGVHVSIKWPNDIRVRDRKLCGILLEGAVEYDRVDYALVGIGLNVNFDPSPYRDVAEVATSLLRETGHAVPRERVLAAVLGEVDEAYRRVQRRESLQGEWRGLLETIGKWVTVDWTGHVEEGLAEDVTEEGDLLLVRRDSSRVVLPAGEVTLQT